MERASNRFFILFLGTYQLSLLAMTTKQVQESSSAVIRPIPTYPFITSTLYHFNSSYFIQQKQLVRVYDPENAICIDIDLQNRTHALHSFPATSLLDRYSRPVLAWFITKCARNALDSKDYVIQRHRFSPTVDQYLTLLGHEYLDLYYKARYNTFVIEDKISYDKWLEHAKKHHLTAFLRIEFDATAFMYDTQKTYPCTFTYHLDPITEQILNREMILHSTPTP